MASDLNEPAKPTPGRVLAVKWRVLISAAVLVHLVAVIAAPMAVPPSSDLQRDLCWTLNPYILAAYLNHGYRFFAPEPSPGHLVRYKLEFPDGSTDSGRFPNLSTEWPRLLYHRHFMLTEKLVGRLPPRELPTDATPEARQDWAQEWRTFNDIAQSYAIHLLSTTGAKRVTLELVSHNLPSPDDMRKNRPLNDPELFQTLWTKSYESKL